MAIAANAVNRLKRNCTITCAVQAFTPKLWCNYAIHFSPYGTSAARPQGAYATRTRYCDCSQTTPTDNDCHRRARLHQPQYPNACRTRRSRCCPGHLCDGPLRTRLCRAYRHACRPTNRPCGDFPRRRATSPTRAFVEGDLT